MTIEKAKEIRRLLTDIESLKLSIEAIDNILDTLKQKETVWLKIESSTLFKKYKDLTICVDTDLAHDTAESFKKMKEAYESKLKKMKDELENL